MVRAYLLKVHKVLGAIPRAGACEDIFVPN